MYSVLLKHKVSTLCALVLFVQLVVVVVASRNNKCTVPMVFITVQVPFYFKLVAFYVMFSLHVFDIVFKSPIHTIVK